jgi:hypothetical protein
VVGDLTKGVETIISSLQTIAKQRPTSGNTAQSSDLSDEEKAEAIRNANRRNERLRAMIDFKLPTDTLGAPGVNESNLIQYLGLLEQKANELLTVNYVVNSTKKVVLAGDQDGVLIPAGGVAGLLGQGPTAPVGHMSIVPPSTA